MSPPATPRKTADERREEILDAALTEFADRGYEAGSTDAIARAAGISQPYLFRLFGTKRDLFIAVVERCFADERARFQHAAEGLTGPPALAAMAAAYAEMIRTDPRRLRGQMQSYAACDDPLVRDVVRREFGRIVQAAEDTGASPEDVHLFFARGMLMNVVASLGLIDAPEPWAVRLVEACGRPH